MIHYIQQSIERNEIVTVDEYDSTGADMLAAECDDCVVNGDVTEYWGTTESGSEWRVHMTNAS